MADASATTQTHKTYVLEGFDHNGAFSGANDIFNKDPNIIVIKAKDGESLKDAIKEANIQGPANIILDAHGVDDGRGNPTGQFTWNKQGKGSPDEYPTYKQLLDDLPKDGSIKSVTITSCYGGTAVKDDILQHGPPGAVIQSTTGARNEGLAPIITRFAETAQQGGSSTDLFVDALVAYDPQKYQQWQDNNNAKGAADAQRKGVAFTPANSDPEAALPHVIGVSGHPPIEIDMTKQTNYIEQKGRSGQLANDQSWSAAKNAVEQKFASGQQADNRAGMNDGMHNVSRNEIEQVAQKMQSGQELQGAEEKRIGFALAAEYMDKSGDLQQRIDTAQGKAAARSQEKAPEVPVTPVPPKDTQHHAGPQHPVVPPKEPPPASKAPEHHTQAPPPPAPDNDKAYFENLAKESLAGFNAALKTGGAQEFAKEAQALDTSAIHKIVDSHKLVADNRQNAAVTAELENFAKMMHLSGVRTDAPKLNDDEIKKIQAALHVKQDGLVGEKTLAALDKAETQVKALATPIVGKAAAPQQQTH